jgi:hypothetical protein
MNKKRYIIILLFLVLFCTVNVYAAESCEGILGSGLYTVIKEDVFPPLRILAPILILICISVDVAKVVFTEGKDNLSKVGQNFLKRAVATLLVFFAPNIIEFLLGLVDKVTCGF